LARQVSKTLSQKTRADLSRACELLSCTLGLPGALDFASYTKTTTANV